MENIILTTTSKREFKVHYIDLQLNRNNEKVLEIKIGHIHIDAPFIMVEIDPFDCVYIEEEVQLLFKIWYDKEKQLHIKQIGKEQMKNMEHLPNRVYNIDLYNETRIYVEPYRDGFYEEINDRFKYKTHKVYKDGNLINLKRFKNDVLSETCEYKDDLKHGINETFDNGELIERNIWKDGILILNSNFYSNGNLSNKNFFDNGKMISIINYNNDGSIFSRIYYGEKDFKAVEIFHRSGYIKQRMYFIGDKGEGSHEIFYDIRDATNAAKNKRDPKFDQLCGAIDPKYFNCVKMIQFYLKNDEIEGLYTVFYKSGNVKSQTNYKNGKKHGLYKNFRKNGDLIKQIHYEDGKKVDDK